MDVNPNYQGPGIYRHYKGGEYLVLGLGLKEDTVNKRAVPNDVYAEWRVPEVVCVVYMPLTPGSMLESRDETFWLRELSDFNEWVDFGSQALSAATHALTHRKTPRFRKIRDLTISADVVNLLKSAEGFV